MLASLLECMYARGQGRCAAFKALLLRLFKVMASTMLANASLSARTWHLAVANPYNCPEVGQSACIATVTNISCDLNAANQPVEISLVGHKY
jgi:hypothetical protein